MHHHDCEELLSQRGSKPTAVRLIVVRALAEAEDALSLTDLEARLGTVDKSGIFRALRLFEEQHLVHTIDDGTGRTKYALCAEGCQCGEGTEEALHDLHVHFRCVRCGHTVCLRSVPVPLAGVPEGYRITDASYVLQGLCPKCSKKTAH